MAAACAVTLASPVLADAEDSETRLSAAATSGLQMLAKFESEGSGAALGGRAEVAFGLSDTFDVGGLLSYAYLPDLEFDDAVVESGSVMDEGNVFANVHRVSVGGTVRYTPAEFRFAGQLRPYVAGRFGLSATLFSAVELFDNAGVFETGLDSDLTLDVFAGPEFGLAWRVSTAWQLAASLTGQFGGAERYVGLSVEVSRFSFSLL